MKLAHILEDEGFNKPKEWQEGSDAYYAGQQLDQCPYEDEERRGHWVNGWQYASQDSD